MKARLIRLSAAAVIFGGIAAVSAAVFSTSALAHGDVVPQAVDTTGLEPLGKDWKESNPYRGNERAIEIGNPPSTRTAPAATALAPYRAASLPICASWSRATAVTSGSRSGCAMAPSATASPICPNSMTRWGRKLCGPSAHGLRPSPSNERRYSPSPDHGRHSRRGGYLPGLAASLDTVMERGVMRFAVYRDFPPFSHRVGGTLEGVDVDLAKAIGAKLGLASSSWS